MSPEQIAAIAARHEDRVTDVCGTRWPCDALLLLREMRTLRSTLEATEQHQQTIEQLRRRTHVLQERHDRECSRLRKQLRAVKRSRDFRRAIDDLILTRGAQSRDVFAPIFERRLAHWYAAFKILDERGTDPGLGLYQDDGEESVPCGHHVDWQIGPV